jgi:hypothetical protein
MLGAVFYIGEGRKPSIINALDGNAAPNIPDRACCLSIFGVILCERLDVMALPGVISPGEKLSNLPGSHRSPSFQRSYSLKFYDSLMRD